jgi:hypothetical protein
MRDIWRCACVGGIRDAGREGAERGCGFERGMAWSPGLGVSDLDAGYALRNSHVVNAMKHMTFAVV